METPVSQQVTPDLPQWTDPVIESYETRPEVTAYAGQSGPWLAR